MNCVQYRDRDCGPRDRIDRLIRRGRMVLLPTARPGADVSALSLYPRDVYTHVYVHRYVYISLFARADLSDEVLRRGKNVARARRALGDDRPPSVLNNGHYVPWHNSLEYRASTGIDCAEPIP